eukprot:14314939-Alexandrium_andersonii.AAC.1
MGLSQGCAGAKGTKALYMVSAGAQWACASTQSRGNAALRGTRRLNGARTVPWQGALLQADQEGLLHRIVGHAEGIGDALHEPG